MIVFPLWSFGQESVTTVEEYNFMTTGLKELMKNGLDQKKDGYTLEIFFETVPSYKTKTKTRYKFRTLKNTNGELKAIGVEMNFSTTSSNFYCIPINNSDLFRKYIKEFDDISGNREIHAAVSEALMFLASKK